MKRNQTGTRAASIACGLLFALVILAPGSASAVSRQFEPETTQIITNPEGQSRVLVDFGDLSGLAGEWISSAHVTLDLTSVDFASDLSLELYGVEESWAGRAPTWSSPWSDPGGDLDEWTGVEAPGAGGRNRGRVRFDVTEIVRQLLSEDNWTEGFLLVATGQGREGLFTAEIMQLGGRIPATLDVTYRKLSAIGVNLTRNR